MTIIEQAAQKILKSIRSTYGAPHTYLPASERDFPHLNLAVYQKVRAELSAKGFRHVADIEIMEATMSHHSVVARAFISCHLSDDGICASHCQIKPKRSHLLRFLIDGICQFRWISAPRTFSKYIHSRHCLALETEFNDDSYVVTGNAEVATMISQPPTVDVEYHPFGTPTQHLLDRHTARIREKLAGVSNLEIVKLASVEDMLKMQTRLQAQKNAHRATLNWISSAELKTMLADRPAEADALFAAVNKLLREEKAEGAQQAA